MLALRTIIRKEAQLTDVQLHRFCVTLEPASEFVLRRKYRPVRRVRQVREMISINRIMQYQVVIAISPVISDAVVLLDYECGDA